MFLTDALTYARMRCGRIESVELSDEEVRVVLLESVVVEFSNLFPKRGQITINLVAGQALYPLPDNVIAVDLHSSIRDEAFNGSGLGNQYTVPYVGMPSISGYADSRVYEYALERIHRLDVDQLSIHGNQLEVHPTPKKSRTLYMLTSEIWVFDTDVDYDQIPRILRQPFQFLLCAKMAETLAANLARVPSLSIGSSRMDVNYNYLIDLAETQRREARSIAAMSALPMTSNG